MLRIYYKIWTDAIAFEKAKKGRAANWKPFVMISISILQGINLLTLLLFIRILTHKTSPVIFPMHIFNRAGLNTFCSIALTFFVPFLILNYLLVFYNDRYEKLLNTYGDKKGKLYGIYALATIGVIVVPFICKLIF